MTLMAMQLKPVRRSGFEAELKRAVEPLRLALGRLIAAVGSPRTPSDLMRKLEAPYTVCWQIYKIVQSEAGVSEAMHAPSARRMKSFLQLAGQQGVAAGICDQVMAAAEEFERFTKEHAEDRESFDSMVTGVAAKESKESGDSSSLRLRREAYRTLSQIFGRQIDTVAQLVLYKGVPGGGFEKCSIAQRLGTRQLREDAPPLRVFGFSVAKIEEHILSVMEQPSLDEDAREHYGVPLLPQFCSSPLPQMRLVPTQGWVVAERVNQEVGLRGSADYVFGQVWKAKGSLFENPNEPIRETMAFISPVRLFGLDIAIHRPSYGVLRPTYWVSHTTQAGLAHEDSATVQRIGSSEKMQLLGGAAEVVETPDVPRVPELMRFACDKMGWDLSEFDVYRLRMEYPIMHTTVAVELELPEPPTRGRVKAGK